MPCEIFHVDEYKSCVARGDSKTFLHLGYSARKQVEGTERAENSDVDIGIELKYCYCPYLVQFVDIHERSGLVLSITYSTDKNNAERIGIDS